MDAYVKEDATKAAMMLNWAIMKATTSALGLLDRETTFAVYQSRREASTDINYPRTWVDSPSGLVR